jgi:hypothetical protein
LFCLSSATSPATGKKTLYRHAEDTDRAQRYSRTPCFTTLATNLRDEIDSCPSWWVFIGSVPAAATQRLEQRCGVGIAAGLRLDERDQGGFVGILCGQQPE